MSTESLWGEIDLSVKLDTPVMLLKQQAIALEKLTKGILTGKVQKYKTDDPKMIGHELVIVAPAIGNYSVAIVSVTHQITLYPTDVISDLENRIVGEAANPDELKAILRSVLQSEDVGKVILALISQSVAEEPA